MIKVILSLCLVFFISLFVTLTPVFAQSPDRTQISTLPKGETINRDYFASGGTVILSGTVNGDAFLAGGNIMVDGTVNGDLLVLGGNITVSGKVTGSLRSVGGQTTINGEVDRNVSAAGGSISVTDKASIHGSLTTASGSLDVSGPVGRGITASGGQVILGSSVGGDVNAIANQLTLTSGAKVNGNLDYTSNNQAQIQSGATVSGKTNQHISPAKPSREVGPLVGFGITFKIISLLAYFIVGLILLRFMPNFFWGKAATLIKSPWLSLVAGIITLIVVPFVVFILMFTLVGIPLALIILGLYLIALYLSVIVSSLALGSKVFELFHQARTGGWALLVGLIIYEILSIIPILGGFVTFFAVIFGFGALLIAWKNLYDNLLTKKII